MSDEPSETFETEASTDAPALQHADPSLHIDVNADPTGARYWQYIGQEERVYPHIPVTIRTHEMIKFDEIPAEDGNWQEVEFVKDDGFIVKMPDNHPDTIAASNAAIAVATTEE